MATEKGVLAKLELINGNLIKKISEIWAEKWNLFPLDQDPLFEGY